MPTIQLEAQLSPDDLLKAVAQLDAAQLEEFVTRVLELKAHRQAPCLSRTETELLEQINRGLPDELRSRYKELIDKREAAALTESEHAELLQLTNQVEMLEAERAQWLTELARLRQKPLSALLHDLGISAAAHG